MKSLHESRSRQPGPWRILTIAVIAQFGVSVIDQGIPTLTGFIKADLQLSAFEAGLIVSSFSFGKILGSYAAGKAADRLGEPIVLIAGGVAAAAFVIGAATITMPWFTVLLVLAGTAGAASTPAGGRLVLLSFPPERRGLALSIRQAGVPLAGFVAAALLPWIAEISSWRWSLVAAGAISSLAVFPLWAAGIQRPEVVIHPAIHRSRVVNRTILLLTVWGCLLVTGQCVLVTFLALDIHSRSNMTLAQASILLAVAYACGTIGRIVWGAVSDVILNHGRKPLLVALNLAGLTSAISLALVPASASLVVLAVVAGVAGLTMIGFQGLWITMVAEAAGPEHVGAATGFAATFIVCTMTIAPPLYGFVADLTGTYRSIWLLLAGMLALALIPAALVENELPE